MANINKRVGYKFGSHPGDANDLARQNADHRVGPLTGELARDNYDRINWKSKQGDK